MNELELEIDRKFNQAIIYYEKEQFAKAVIAFNELLKNYSSLLDTWNIHYWLGLSYLKSNDFKRAIENLKIAIDQVDCSALGSDCFEINRNLANACFWQGSFSEALAAFNNAFKFFEKVQGSDWSTARYLFHLNKGKTHLYLLEYENAIKEYNQARNEIKELVDPTPRDKSILDYEIARALLYSRHINESLELLMSIKIEEFPVNCIDEFHYTLANAYFKKNEFKNALSNLSKIDLNKIHKGYLANLYFISGVCNLKLQYYDLARTHLEQSIKLNPDQEVMKLIGDYLNELKTIN